MGAFEAAHVELLWIVLHGKPQDFTHSYLGARMRIAQKNKIIDYSLANTRQPEGKAKRTHRRHPATPTPNLTEPLMTPAHPHPPCLRLGLHGQLAHRALEQSLLEIGSGSTGSWHTEHLSKACWKSHYGTTVLMRMARSPSADQIGDRSFCPDRLDPCVRPGPNYSLDLLRLAALSPADFEVELGLQKTLRST